MRVCRFSNPIPSLFPPQSPRSTGDGHPNALVRELDRQAECVNNVSKSPPLQWGRFRGG